VIGSRSAREAAAQLLVRCLVGLGCREDRLPALATGNVNWHRFLGLAERHAVAEGAHLALELNGAAAPDPFRATLRAAYELAAARNTVLLAEAERVQAALAAGGIESLLLKGTALLASLPAMLGARHVGDVDLLVSPDDLPRANRVARDLGCRPLAPDGCWYDGSPIRPGDQHHAPPLITPAGATLELHGRAGHAAATADWTPALLARSVAARWGARGRLRVPGLDDQVALLCEHVVDGHPCDRRFLPRHLGDLAMLSAAGASFDRAAALGGAAAAIVESRALFEAASRGHLAAESLFLRSGDPLRARCAAMGKALETARPRGGAWRMLLPSPAFMAHRYGVPQRSALVPLLYLWRPARSAWRLIAGR
jgi:hypothetical protein